MRFQYNDDKHLYTLDEKPLANVTSILAAVSVDVADRKMISNGRHLWKPINDIRWITDDDGIAAQFGTNLHLVAAYKLKGIECEYDEEMQPWVDGIDLFFKEHGDRFEIVQGPPLMVEVPMYHKTLKIAGTADWFAKDLKTGQIGCLDWKTSEAYKDHWRYQTAAYTDMIKDYMAITCGWTASIRILNGNFKLDIRNGLDFKKDLAHWKSIVNVYNLMMKGRSK